MQCTQSITGAVSLHQNNLETQYSTVSYSKLQLKRTTWDTEKALATLEFVIHVDIVNTEEDWNMTVFLITGNSL